VFHHIQFELKEKSLERDEVYQTEMDKPQDG
jgi:hypothetical protein